MRFAAALGPHIYPRKLGELFDAQTGFRMKSRDVLSPDISFIGRPRLAGLNNRHLSSGCLLSAPHLRSLVESASSDVANGPRSNTVCAAAG